MPDQKTDAAEEVQPLGRVGAAAHLFKTIVGAGIFFLPVAMKNSGWLIAVVLAAALTYVVIDVTGMLVDTRALVKGELNDAAYVMICTRVLGKRWGALLRWSLAIVQLCWCLVYFQLVAGMFAEIFHQGPSSSLYIAVCLLEGALLFPISLFSRDLARLAFMSVTAVVLFWIVFANTLLDVGQHLSDKGVAESAVAVAPPLRWLAFLPTMLSALGGIATVLPVHDAMAPKDQYKAYKGVFAVVCGGIGVLYAGCGLLGYLTFGSELKATLISLETGSAVRLVFAMSLLLSIPIQFVPSIEVVDARIEAIFGSDVDYHKPVWKDRRAMRNRALLCVELSVIAAVVGADTVDVVVSLIGSTVVNIINVITPASIFLGYHLLAPVSSPADSAEATAEVEMGDSTPAASAEAPEEVTESPEPESACGGLKPLPDDIGPISLWKLLPWNMAAVAAEGRVAPIQRGLHGRVWAYLVMAILIWIIGLYTSIQDAIHVFSSRK